MFAPMESIRQKKITALIHQRIAEIFRYETSNQKKLISVSQVYITADLGLAKIYLSIFPIEQKENILLEITKQSKHYRNLLGRCIGSKLRKVPELRFYLDNSLSDLENIHRELRGEGENPIKI